MTCNMCDLIAVVFTTCKKRKEYIRKTGIGGAKPEYMVVLCARGIRGKRNFRILVVS